MLGCLLMLLFEILLDVPSSKLDLQCACRISCKLNVHVVSVWLFLIQMLFEIPLDVLNSK